MRDKVYDVVVVGAGINGAAIAFNLTLIGLKNIAIIDRAYPGAGASGRGMGLLRTYHANSPEALLAIKSLEVFRNWKDVVGGTCGFVETGFLWLDKPSRRTELERDVAMIQSLGGRSHLIDEAALRELQPHMACENTIAVCEPECGYAYGALATDAFHQASRRRGAELLTRTTVTALRLEGGRVTGVSTTRGDISTGAVVLAAGAWTKPLVETVGISLPVEARRLTLGRVYMPESIKHPMAFLDATFDTSFKADGNQTALISMRDSRYGSPIDPDALQDDVDGAAVQSGIDRIARRIPALRDAVGAQAWTGVDGFTPDFKGIYGRVGGVEGLFVCAGASEKGFKVAPAVGMGLARLIAGERCEFIEDPLFSAQRFAQGGIHASAGIDKRE